MVPPWLRSRGAWWRVAAGSDRRDIRARSSRSWPVVQRGLEVEAASCGTFRWLALDRCGPQVAAHDRQELALHRRGDGDELLSTRVDELAGVEVQIGQVDAVEIETMG